MWRNINVAFDEHRTTNVSNQFHLMGRLNTVPWEYILLPERRFINLQHDEIKSSRGAFLTCVGFSYTKKRNPSQKNIIPWEDIVFLVGRVIYVSWDDFKWSHGRFFPCVGSSYTTENHLMSWLQTIPWDGKKSHGPKWWFIIIPWDGPFLTKCHPMGSFESERMIFDRPMGWSCPCDEPLMPSDIICIVSRTHCNMMSPADTNFGERLFQIPVKNIK